MTQVQNATQSNPAFKGTAIVAWLKNNDTAIGRALVVLRNEQTNDELDVLASKHLNRRGFKKADAKRGTLDADFFEQNGYLTAEQLAYWRTPTKQGQRLTVYWRQLVAAAYRKAQVDAMKKQATAYRNAKQGVDA
jgi:hypothetical protein